MGDDDLPVPRPSEALGDGARGQRGAHVGVEGIARKPIAEPANRIHGLAPVATGGGAVPAEEAHKTAHGCHSAWLDTFRAKAFYLALGYEPFGVLDNYPVGQSRIFMKKH